MGDEVTGPRQFSWGPWIGGLLLALFLGCIGNVFAGLLALGTPSKSWVLAPLIGIIPGLLIGLVAFLLRERARSLALGIFTGACVVALVGGICSAALVGQSVAG